MKRLLTLVAPLERALGSSRRGVLARHFNAQAA